MVYYPISFLGGLFWFVLSCFLGGLLPTALLPSSMAPGVPTSQAETVGEGKGHNAIPSWSYTNRFKASQDSCRGCAFISQHQKQQQTLGNMGNWNCHFKVTETMLMFHAKCFGPTQLKKKKEKTKEGEKGGNHLADKNRVHKNLKFIFFPPPEIC